MKKSLYYRFFYRVARIAFPRAETSFEEQPDEAAVFICNHSAIRGPVMMTLDFPRPHRNWVISCSMTGGKLTESYAFHDILFGNSRRFKAPDKLLAKLIALALPPILRTDESIPVYHDRRITETFRNSIKTLEEGKDVVIFAESPKRYSEYVNELQRGFVDLGAMYYKKTGKTLKFYPVYIEKKNRKIAVGAPISYDPNLLAKNQRDAICEYLRDGIDRMARGMKPHKPVLFLPQRWYDAYGQYEDDFYGYWKMIYSADTDDSKK